MPKVLSSPKAASTTKTPALLQTANLRLGQKTKLLSSVPIVDADKVGGSRTEDSAAALAQRSPIRSRIALAQGSRMSSRVDRQSLAAASSSGNASVSEHIDRPTQHCISRICPVNQVENYVSRAHPHEGRFRTKQPGMLRRVTEPEKTANGEPSLDPPAFEDKNRNDSHPNGLISSSLPTATAGKPNRLLSDGISASSGKESAPQPRSSNEKKQTPQLAGQQFCQLSAGKEGSCGAGGVANSGNANASLNAEAPSKAPAIQSTNEESHVGTQLPRVEQRSSGEARGSGTHPSVGRAGYVLDSHGGNCDAVTIDTRDSISRSRLSAQVLRGILGSSERKSASTPARQSNRAGTGGVNPLHHTSRGSDSAEEAEMQHHGSFDRGDGTSLSHSSATRIDVRADELHPCGDEGEYDAADTFGDDQSFANRRGELEWLRTPSLFYFFANVIKWNELQLQRRELMSSWQTHQHRSNRGSLSLVSVWTQHRERELRTLEAHISFSAFELRGVYLNRLLMHWSKPKLRSLVADVVATWRKEGPSSAEFDVVSSRLFDAISSEEACQLRCTWVFSVRRWLGLAQNRWIVTGMLITCFAVSVLCIVFLAVFGRTRVAVCAALSAVLGVAVIVMYMLAMFVLHHNAYATAAATYFREAAVRAAQRNMEEEEELEEADELSGTDNSLGSQRDKYVRPHDRDMGGLADSNASDTRSDYTVEQMSLAVRNLRMLTEGNAQPAGPGAPYYRLPSNLANGRRESGTAAGGYYDDDMTLTDENVPSLTSRPLQEGDAARQKQDLDRDSTLLLSTVVYKQHQEYLKQRQSLLVQETMSSSKARSDKAGNTEVDHYERLADERRTANGSAGLQQLANLPDKLSIIALIYCNNAGLLSDIAPSLWERMFMLLRVADLHALDSAFKHGSERFKVILIHAPDAPDGSEVLRTALMWLQVERRPVFFISRQVDAFSFRVPTSARLLVPLTAAAVNTLLLAGIGVEAELGSVSFPAFLQQEQQLSPSQPFQVPPYVLGRRLGGGAFGNVFEAEMEESGAKCAVKRMYLKEDSDNGGPDEQGGHSSTTANTSAGVSANGGETKSTAGETCHTTSSETGEVAGETASNPDADGGTTAVGSQLREIAQEVEIMSSLQHPNIVHYYFCERDDNCISIFMELCTGGSLSSLIHSGKLVNPPEIKLLLREIISAVAYLHSLRIVHRDLKPDNVLFRHGHAKITDFGTAVHKHGDGLRLIKGTFAYMAPETLVGEPYGSACDVWSIGCIAAEVLSVDLPQHALGLPAMCEYYRAMEENSTLPIECDVPGVRDFLLACLRRNPNQRSTAAELFYHPILQARDTSIQRWMEKVVEQRRQKHNLQHNMSHRIGPGGRGSGGPGSVHGGPTSRHGSNADGADGGDLFDLNSNNGSIISLDSSQLTGHEEHRDSLLTS